MLCKRPDSVSEQTNSSQGDKPKEMSVFALLFFFFLTSGTWRKKIKLLKNLEKKISQLEVLVRRY